MQHFLGFLFLICHNNYECLKSTWRLSVMVKQDFIVFCKHSGKMPLFVIEYGPSTEFFLLLNHCRDYMNWRKEKFRYWSWMNLHRCKTWFLNEFKATQMWICTYFCLSQKSNTGVYSSFIFYICVHSSSIFCLGKAYAI